MSHKCPRIGCRQTIADRLLMCGGCWGLVPKRLQRAVYAAYKSGRGLGSPQLLAAQEAAIRAANGEPEAAAGSPS